jgi:hypothetical protein
MRLYFVHIQSETAMRKVTDDVTSELMTNLPLWYHFYSLDTIFHHNVIIGFFLSDSNAGQNARDVNLYRITDDHQPGPS